MTVPRQTNLQDIVQDPDQRVVKLESRDPPSLSITALQDCLPQEHLGSLPLVSPHCDGGQSRQEGVLLQPGAWA